MFILYFNVSSFSKVHSLAIYFSQACKDQDSWRTNCIHSFSWPSMKLVACLVHSNRGEKEAFIFICPYPTGNQASGQKAMKSLFRRHLARLNGKKFTGLICPQITMCSFQTGSSAFKVEVFKAIDYQPEDTWQQNIRSGNQWFS